MVYQFVLSTSLCTHILKRYLAFANGAISRSERKTKGKPLTLMLRNKQTKQKQANKPQTPDLEQGKCI